jgi:UDP-N-acetylglucosamine transferase subunit ALG13
MIFVSFGNVPIPFLRLAKAIDLYALTIEEEVIVQCGNTEFNFKHCKVMKFIDHDEMILLMKNASIVVLQGGWGAISEASNLGCKIVSVPRILNTEHNHDQFQLVEALEKHGVLLGVYDIKELAIILEKARSYVFLQIIRGNAKEIINKSIKEWMKKKK